MSNSFEKYQKRRLISSYFSVVVSIALVLFIVGILGLLVLNTKKVADYFKEQIALTIFLKDTANEVEITQLQNTLSLAEYTKSAHYVTKEEAAENLAQEIGEDFISFLGDNPLQNSIDVFLNADFVTSELIDEISNDLLSRTYVDDVVYDKPLIVLLNENITRISFWVLIIAGVFTFIAVLLINSSIRLSIYSKRFIIKTMQMVGATKSFIRKPFILKSLKLGIIGIFLAWIAMALVIYFINKSLPFLMLLDDLEMLAILFFGIFVLGLLIIWLSTFFATQRFLNLKTDELYF